jgi:hypothetical protein
MKKRSGAWKVFNELSRSFMRVRLYKASLVATEPNLNSIYSHEIVIASGARVRRMRQQRVGQAPANHFVHFGSDNSTIEVRYRKCLFHDKGGALEEVLEIWVGWIARMGSCRTRLHNNTILWEEDHSIYYTLRSCILRRQWR